MRPREGHDLRIVGGRVEIEPTATVRWLRDVEGNSVALVTFAEPGRTLRVLAEMDVDLYDDRPIECLIDPGARSFPFQYAPEEQVELVPYRLPSYPYDGPALQSWLLDLYRPGQTIDTFELLDFVDRWARFEVDTFMLLQVIDHWAAPCRGGGLGCYCPDPMRCHRSVLRTLLEEHGARLA
jgi:hypothetical protein